MFLCCLHCIFSVTVCSYVFCTVSFQGFVSRVTLAMRIEWCSYQVVLVVPSCSFGHFLKVAKLCSKFECAWFWSTEKAEGILGQVWDCELTWFNTMWAACLCQGFKKTRLTQKRLEESETGLVVYPRKDETLGDVFCPRGDGAGGDEALEAADLVGQRGRAAWHRVHAGGGGREVHPRRVAVAVRSPPLRRTRTAAATCWNPSWPLQLIYTRNMINCTYARMPINACMHAHGSM